LPGWLAQASGIALRGYEIHMGETQLTSDCRPALLLQKNGESIADGAVSDDGLVFGTYLHGLFDSNAFTRAVVNGLRARKGLAALTSTVDYASYKSQQFDILAAAMRQNIDIEKVYQVMREHQEATA
jgi:adenosylcobyric acid synthase